MSLHRQLDRQLEAIAGLPRQRQQKILDVVEAMISHQREQMAKRLGVSQPVVSDYERGGLRLHGELILKVAEILDLSANELLGLDTKAAPKKRGPQSQLEKANGRDSLLAAQGTTAAFGRCQSFHLTPRRAVKKQHSWRGVNPS